MTTIIYEHGKGKGGRDVAHITYDQKKTICGKQVKNLSETGAEKHGHCKKCWASFS